MNEGKWHNYRVHFIIIFLLVSFNLRMSFSAADPLLVFLMRDLGLSVAGSGLFGLLPIMSLGIAAPLGARLAGIVRPRVLIVYALLFAIGGVVWRSYGGIPGLYGGTVAIGLGLGITGSVILGIVKQVFPGEIPVLMGAYTACVSLGTAVGSGAADPIALALGGWQMGLLFWAIPLLVAVILWLELIISKHPPEIKQHTLRSPLWPLLRQRKAWDVSLFYLFRVAGAWLLIVWMATLMRQRGLPMVEAGLVLAIATACQIPSALLTAAMCSALGSRTRLLLVVVPLSILSCWGLLEGPLAWWPLFSICFGLSIGCIFSIGMTLIVVNAADEASTVALSGMAQGIGFITGGVLAWGASLLMNSPRADLWIAGSYTLFALLGLYFGWRCDRSGLVSVAQDGEKR
ncbi:MAG: MFS transporter [Akkermansia sp.]|nr:MFS transporter [Akkermansia sp.]